MPVTANGRTADHDIEPIFLHRWSPRAFTGEPIPHASLMSLFEAARWAPSAFNLQPWRFVYAVRDTPDWERLLSVLIAYNQAWVRGASALIFVISDRFRRKSDGDKEPLYSHSFDAGAAWAYLALQAHHLGLAAHGMTGFDPERAYEELGVPEADYRIEAAVAVGRPADKSVLPEAYQAREAPSLRAPAAGFVFEGRFKA
ncbi:MAG TPA: nitroreductase family protein [Caulobacteraceae bacterium]|jgi:nitroreductase|nr:nitroreductase family protein [Caulobacteraceae bacterium]